MQLRDQLAATDFGLATTTLDFVARYFDVHPENPQPRMIGQVVDLLRAGGLVAYPTDSCFALGCQPTTDRAWSGFERSGSWTADITSRSSAQTSPAGRFVQLDNVIFRALKASTPGQYTFIVPATREVPRRMLYPKRRTVGVRIPDHVVAQAILAGLGEPSRVEHLDHARG